MKRSLLAVAFAAALVCALTFFFAPAANASSITLQPGETLNITADAILDLAGNSGSVHVADGVKLTVIDSANTGLSGEGAGKLTVLSGEVAAEAEDAAGRRFLKLQNADGTFSFHPFYVTIKQVGINTYMNALCVQAMFVANETAQQAITTGVVYGDGALTNTAPTYDYFSFEDGVMYAYFDLIGSLDSQAAMEKVKSFRAYITVGGETIYSKTIATVSPLETLNTVSARFDDFSEKQQTALMNMIDNNPQLHEVPSVAGLIHFLADKQTVEEMNEALTYVRAESFGTAKESLREYGFGNDDNFVPETAGYSFCWYAEKGMIVLVDDTDKVVYPTECSGADANDVRMFFDMSLPTAIVYRENDQMINGWDIGTYGVGNEEISVLYTFQPENLDENSNYSHWYADFYISFTKADGTPLYTKNDVMSYLAAIKLGGFYNGWSLGPFRDVSNDGKEDWLILPVAGDNPNNNYDPVDILDRNGEVPLVLTIMQSSDPDGADSKVAPSYAMLLSQLKLENGVAQFKCGVADVEGGADEGVRMYVELRLTNPENAENQVVIGMYSYTFQ